MYIHEYLRANEIMNVLNKSQKENTRLLHYYKNSTLNHSIPD